MSIRVYAEAPEPNIRSMERIITNLKRYAPPSVIFVSESSGADLVLLHVNGRPDRAYRQANQASMRRQRFAVIQYCVRSTLEPETHRWWDLWHEATLVWSYYDLNGLRREDHAYGYLTNTYCSPLGADSDVFVLPDSDRYRPFKIGMSGGGPMVESIREAAYATAAGHHTMFHLGPLSFGSHITAVENVSDTELATWYQQCQYFGGLRRKEGFEMCCAEALLCGARPIFFDRIHYRQWFNDFGLFIPEGSRDAVIQSLTDIFQQPVIPVSPDERAAAAARFHWPSICTEFWRRCL